MTKLTELMGQKDARGPQGQMARGNNIYNGGSNAAQQGGGQQFGRPGSFGAPPGLQVAGQHAPADKSFGLQQLLGRLGLLNPQPPMQQSPFQPMQWTGGAMTPESGVPMQPFSSDAIQRRRMSGGA